MKRRNFIIGVGAASVGSAGAIGTGAVSSITADRGVKLRIARDDNAYLEFDPLSQLASLDTDGILEIDLTKFNDLAEGEGFNKRSVYVVTDADGDATEGVFGIRNQSDREVKIASTTVSDIEEAESDEPGNLDYDALDETDPRIELFKIDGDSRTAIDSDNPVTLSTGQQILVGLRITVPKDADFGSRTLQQIVAATEA